MDDEKLIENVRKYQLLYDLSHPKYMDPNKKDQVWKEISEQVRQPVAACKQRWQSLRDAYRRALNKRKTKSGSRRIIKKWKYEDEMSFLPPFFVDRRNVQSGDASSEEEAQEVEDNAQSDNVFGFGTAYIGGTNVDEYGNRAQESCEAQENGEAQSTNNQQMSTSALLMAHLLQDTTKQDTKNNVDPFFMSMSQTVAKFSPYQQAVAKRRIFNIVSEMELEHLSPSPITIKNEKCNLGDIQGDL